MKDCMMRDGFRKKALGNNGHIYLKVLKEVIMDELKVSEPVDIADFAFENLNTDPQFKVEMEGKYNTQSINNLDALGYDNFEKRMHSQDI